jgi:GNAT superfamily N-acetyltransferase
MRDLMNIVESVSDIKFVSDGDNHYTVMISDQTVAVFLIDKDAYEDAYSVHLAVKEPYRRRGVGKAIYDFVEELAKADGKILRPGRGLTDDAHRGWLKRNPDMVADHKKVGKHTWGNPKRA